MKIDMKWVYGLMFLLVVLVIGMEVSNRGKVAKLRAQIEEMQKEMDKRYVDNRKKEPFEKLIFDEQKLCNKGAVPRVLLIDLKDNFKYYDNYEIAMEIDKTKNPDYTGKVNIENRKMRFYVKSNQEYVLRHYGYIYDWDEAGMVKGIETREENFHVDYCNGASK